MNQLGLFFCRKKSKFFENWRKTCNLAAEMKQSKHHDNK